MASLTGVLLDVSGSMKQNINAGDSNTQSGPWVRSVFKTVDNLIRYDVSSENHVFAVGVGAEDKREIFDVLNTIQETKKSFDRLDHREVLTQSRKQRNYSVDSIDHREVIDEILSILNRGGARYVRDWATVDVVSHAVTQEDAIMILEKLQSDSMFVHDFVYKYLPAACVGESETAIGGLAMAIGAKFVTKFIQATEDDIEEVIRKAKGSLVQKAIGSPNAQIKLGVDMFPVSKDSILSVHTASEILHGCIDEGETLTDSRVDELMKAVEPHIYGGTPLYAAMEATVPLFRENRFRDHKKLLFILSDGEPADRRNNSIRDLKQAGVTVACCYVTNANILHPKRLYTSEQADWDKASKLMFNFSSTLPTELLPRTIFIKRGWNIEIDNNETKLFVQVNHPDIIDDVCDLARNVVCCQDALCDTLTCVSLDLYINQCNSGFNAQEQIGGTCYANASAAVLHLAMKRILGRDNGYPEFSELRDKMIRKYGEHGANTQKVLQEICPEYRLNSQEVSSKDAFKAIIAKRPVVAKFRLTENEWSQFGNFYHRNPTGILTKRNLDISKRRDGDKPSGHAVVLTSFNSQCLRLMNSWGSDWADKGFFKVENADILGLKFFDVFWNLDDLSDNEKAYYDTHGPRVAADLMARLKGLQQSRYTCPLCEQESLVTEFTGNLVNAICPKCYRQFQSDEAGNILALNMYLTSLGGD